MIQSNRLSFVCFPWPMCRCVCQWCGALHCSGHRGRAAAAAPAPRGCVVAGANTVTILIQVVLVEKVVTLIDMIRTRPLGLFFENTIL